MARRKRYSYIKNPYSASGWYCFGLGGAALVVTFALIFRSVRTDGAVSLLMAAAGLCAILLDITGLLFGILSLGERKRNQTFAVIGVIMALAVLAAWTLIFRMTF